MSRSVDANRCRWERSRSKKSIFLFYLFFTISSSVGVWLEQLTWRELTWLTWKCDIRKMAVTPRMNGNRPTSTPFIYSSSFFYFLNQSKQMQRMESCKHSTTLSTFLTRSVSLIFQVFSHSNFLIFIYFYCWNVYEIFSLAVW